MDLVVDEIVKPEDLKKFENQYLQQVARGEPSDKATFEYAWCLIRSQSKSDMSKGIALMERLFKTTKDDLAKRDYLFYMAVGCTRAADYEKAQRYANGFLQVEPDNHQARDLLVLIKKRMKKDGMTGMALLGGALAVGGVVAAGVAATVAVVLSKK